MIILQIIFWTGLFLVFFSYVIFPLILQVAGKHKKLNSLFFSRDELPHISVLIAAHNEEEVILSKVKTVLESDYPGDKIEILIGSDNSTDQTNRIVMDLAQKDNRIISLVYNIRKGKPGIINELAEKSSGDILIITDANVMLDKNTLTELVKHFKNEQIGLVDTQMVNTRLKEEGISYQERYYISREVKIKHLESKIWGAMMGPFGGCFAIRKSLFKPVPDKFLVDDFYLNMVVLQQGYQTISNLDAVVYEDVSNSVSEEFRRKKRISAGNFQNLFTFRKLLLPGRKGVAFAFFSHKVLRWFIPFIAILTLLSSAFLAGNFLLYRIALIIQLIVLIIPLIDLFLRKIKIQILPLRFISHFVMMNLALLAGFFRYIGGVRSNVWQPTRRFQN